MMDNYNWTVDTFMYLDKFNRAEAHKKDIYKSHAPEKYQILSQFPWRVHVYNDEKDMLNATIKYFSDHAPDMILGWNSSGGYNRKRKRYIPGFDMQYYFSRLKKLRLDYTRLSPIGEVYIRREGEVIVKLVQLIDLMLFYQASQTKEPKFLSLNYVSKKHIKARKIKRKGTVQNLLDTDPPKAREYNAVDMELCALLDENLNLEEQKQKIADEDGIFVQDTLKMSLGWDIQFLREFNKMKIALPNKHGASGKTYRGGHVYKAFVGVETWVAVLDLSKLYPNIMMTINADPRTLVMNPEDPTGLIGVPVEGVYFKKEPQSIYVKFYEKYISLRNQYKAEMKKWRGIDKAKYNMLNELQKVTKYKTNALYGFMGMEYSRLFSIPIAESTTVWGQTIVFGLEIS